MIKNLIFDLGGVLIDLGFERMCAAFEKLGVADFASYFNLSSQQDFFLQLELGQISEADFYDKFRAGTASNLTDAEIRSAWNLILTDFQPARMRLIDDLRQDYHVYLFSNTNAIHADSFEANCLAITGRPLASYFDGLYYSHTLHLRKPDTTAFQAVCAASNLTPAECLFIDDNADNITGARTAGLQAYQLKTPTSLLDLDFPALIAQANKV